MSIQNRWNLYISENEFEGRKQANLEQDITLAKANQDITLYDDTCLVPLHVSFMFYVKWWCNDVVWWCDDVICNVIMLYDDVMMLYVM